MRVASWLWGCVVLLPAATAGTSSNPPPSRFIVMSHQHSGTSFLRSVMGSLKRVTMWTELFLHDKEKHTGARGGPPVHIRAIINWWMACTH